MGFGEVIVRILGAILATALVLFLAWLLLRWMNRSMPGSRTGSGRMIKVLDRVSLGKSSGLLLVQVQDRVLLVGYSEHGTQTLAEFENLEEFQKELEKNPNPSFQEALKDAAKQMRNRGKKGPDEGEGDE